MTQPSQEVLQRAQSFFSWFCANAEDIEHDTVHETESLTPTLRELDERVHEIHPSLSWEIGPAESDWFFALSPAGSPELFQLTAAVVRDVQPPPGWKFLPAKPRKEWNRSLIMSGRSIDVSSWRYRLRRSGDGQLGIIWRCPSRHAELAGSLGWLVLESEVGEEYALRHFVDVKMVPAKEWNESEPDGSIGVLARHVSELLGEPVPE